jgi:hypothetical protein
MALSSTGSGYDEGVVEGYGHEKARMDPAGARPHPIKKTCRLE